MKKQVMVIFSAFILAGCTSVSESIERSGPESIKGSRTEPELSKCPDGYYMIKMGGVIACDKGPFPFPFPFGPGGYNVHEE